MKTKSALRTVPSSKSLSDRNALPTGHDETNGIVSSSQDISNCWRRHSYHQHPIQQQQLSEVNSATVSTIVPAVVGTEERATSTVMPSSQQVATSTSDLDATIAAGVPRQIQDDCCVILSPSALCTGSVESGPPTVAADTATATDSELICRICHSSETEVIVARGSNSTGANDLPTSNPLISPCLCSGSLKYVHRDCLQYWVKSQDIKLCELCHFAFAMSVSTKPMREWRKLDMSAMERRKIICSVAFHVIALTCVVWSLYVLIEKTAMEVGSGKLEWSFWTKLVVVAIGFTGGLVFMYVQCRTYVSLCRRWRSFNRTFLIESAAEADLDAARDRIKIEQQLMHRQQQQQQQPLSLTI